MKDQHYPLYNASTINYIAVTNLGRTIFHFLEGFNNVMQYELSSCVAYEKWFCITSHTINELNREARSVKTGISSTGQKKCSGEMCHMVSVIIGQHGHVTTKG